MNEIVITRGADAPAIPPPAATRKYKYPFADLGVGDMFFLPGREENSFATYVSLWGRKLKRTFRSRLLYMAKDDKGVWQVSEKDAPGAQLGVGVWRVKGKDEQDTAA